MTIEWLKGLGISSYQNYDVQDSEKVDVREIARSIQGQNLSVFNEDKVKQLAKADKGEVLDAYLDGLISDDMKAAINEKAEELKYDEEVLVSHFGEETLSDMRKQGLSDEKIKAIALAEIAAAEDATVGWEGNPDIEDGEAASQEIQDKYVSLVENLAQYLARTETDTLDVEHVQELTLDELEDMLEDEGQNIYDPAYADHKSESSEARYAALSELIDFLNEYGKPELDAPFTNIENIAYKAEEEPAETTAQTADEPEDKPEEEGLGFWGTIGKYTGISSMLSSVEDKNQRLELHTKVSKGAAYPVSLAGEFGAEITDVGAFVAEIPNEYGLDQLEKAVDKLHVEEVKDNGDQAKKAGADIVAAAASPFKAVGGLLNLAGGTADNASYLLKGGIKNNEVVKDMNEKTLQSIVNKLKDDSIENYNEIKTAIREEYRWGISTEDLNLMTADQRREIIQKEQTPEAVKSVTVKTKDENGNEVEKTIKLHYADKEVVMRAAADAIALYAQNQKSATLMTHQDKEGWDKLEKGYAQVRDSVSDLANAPAAVVDLADAGLSAGIEAVTNKGVADFITAPFKIVTGAAQMVTTSFDDKEGSTTAAAKKFWKGITFGFGGDDEEEPVKVTKNEHKITTDEDLRAEDKKAMDALYIEKRKSVLGAIQTIKADAVIGIPVARLRSEGYTEEQINTVIKAAQIDTIAHREVAKGEETINTAAAALLNTKGSIKLDDAIRQAQRNENENVAGTAFWNFTDKSHSNAENKAGDRGFWKNAGAVAEGIAMTPVRELTTSGVTVANMVAGSIGCVEVAVPIMAGARGVQKLVEGSTKIYNNNYNEANKKAGYEDLGEGLAYIATSTALGIFGGTNHQTKCWHGKRHHSHKSTPHQPTNDEIFINDPSHFTLAQ